MPSTTTSDVLGHADMVLIRERLDANPQFVPQLSPPVRMVYDWVLVILRLLYRSLVLVLNICSDRIDALEARLNDLQANPIFDFKPQDQPQPAPSTPRAPQRPSKPTRCQRCHAMGHTVADCRTQDPATMKKRVAATQKAAKEMEHRRIAALLPRAPADNTRFHFDLVDFFGDTTIPPRSSSQRPTRTMTTCSMAMAADASKLCRRKIQSTRDKRRHAKSTNSTT